MLGVGQLPVQQYHAGCKKEAPAEETTDKEHGGEHHKMSPVINPAVDAAFILHNTCLEGAEQKDADIIAEEVENRQHKQVRVPYDFKQVKDPPESVKNQPYLRIPFYRLELLLAHL